MGELDLAHWEDVSGGASEARAIDRFAFVTNTMRDDLERFVALLREWQRTHNLISSADLGSIWTRHVADSLQLWECAPADWGTWVDLGSGAGFPGLIIAVVAKELGNVPQRSEFTSSNQPPPPPPPSSGQAQVPFPLPRSAEEGRLQRQVTLVESSMKKAAFLRAAIRETGAPALVAAERIEAHAPKAGQADVVSARALAPLEALCAVAQPYLHKDSVLLLLKGQDFVHEQESASKAWAYDMVTIPSVTNRGGQVVAIRNLERKVRS